MNLRKDGVPEIGTEPDRIPGVSIHLETNDLDPANTERYIPENIETNQRIMEMEKRLDVDNSNLQKVISMQAAKIQEITQLAMATFTVLDSLTSKKYSNPNFYFDEKK